MDTNKVRLHACLDRAVTELRYAQQQQPQFIVSRRRKLEHVLDHSVAYAQGRITFL